MPIVQTAIIREIPEKYRGKSWPMPSSAALRPSCDAEEIPDLAAEGITGPIRILGVSNASTRQRPDGQPMMLRVEFCCVPAGGELPRGVSS